MRRALQVVQDENEDDACRYEQMMLPAEAALE